MCIYMEREKERESESWTGMMWSTRQYSSHRRPRICRERGVLLTTYWSIVEMILVDRPCTMVV